MITIVAAMSKNRVIDQRGVAPWWLPADRRHFRGIVEEQTVLFGFKTYQAVKAYYEKKGKKMPYRRVLVHSKYPGFIDDDVLTVHSIDDVMEMASDVFVCGGGAMYRLFLPYADFLELTYVDTIAEGDATFPEINPDEFEETHRIHRDADAENKYAMDFVTYRRKP